MGVRDHFRSLWTTAGAEAAGATRAVWRPGELLPNRTQLALLELADREPAPPT